MFSKRIPIKCEQRDNPYHDERLQEPPRDEIPYNLSQYHGAFDPPEIKFPPAKCTTPFTGLEKDYEAWRRDFCKVLERSGMDSATKPDGNSNYRIQVAAFDMLRDCVKIIQHFPKQAELATEPSRRRTHKIVERCRPQTVYAALQKLDNKFGFAATATNRDAKLSEIDNCNQEIGMVFTDWYDSLDALVTDYKDLGGSYSDEMLLNKMEQLASTQPVRAGLHSWAQRIESARGTYRDDLNAIVKHLEGLEKKDERFASKSRPGGRDLTNNRGVSQRMLQQALLTVTPSLDSAQPDQGDPNMPAGFISQDNLASVMVALEKEGICYGCLKPGHFFLDKDADGKFICGRAQELDAKGLLPAPRKSGRTQKVSKLKSTTKVLTINNQTLEVGTQDDDNVNAPQHGSDDEGTSSDGGSRSLDKAEKQESLSCDNLQSCENLQHALCDTEEAMQEPLDNRAHLRFKSKHMPVHAVRLPSYYMSPTHNKLYAACSPWVWDSGSKVNCTGDKSMFLGPLKPSGIAIEGAVPGVWSETLCGDAKLRFRQNDGTFGPWVHVENMLYVPGLKINILSKNLITRKVRGNLERTSIRRDGDSYVLPQGWRINVMEIDLLDTVFVQAQQSGLDLQQAYPVMGGTHSPININSMKQKPSDYIGLRFRQTNSDGSFNDGTIVTYESATRRWQGHFDEPIPTDDGLKSFVDYSPTELARCIRDLAKAHPMQLNSGQWLVQKIHARARRNNRDHFLVQWKGFPDSTWEPSANLRGGNLSQDMADAPLWDSLTADVQQFMLHPPLPKDISWDLSSHGGDTDMDILHSHPLNESAAELMENKTTSCPENCDNQVIQDITDQVMELDDDMAAGIIDEMDADFLDPDKNQLLCDPGWRNQWSAKERVNLTTHCALGHRSREAINQIQKLGFLNSRQWYKDAALPFCDACARGSLRRPGKRLRFHTGSLPRDALPGELLCLDMLPLQRKSLGGFTNLLICVDSASRYIIVKPIKKASEHKIVMQQIIALWNSRGWTVKGVRDDRGSNFLSESTKEWLAASNINLEPTIADEHHQVGIVEKHIDLMSRMALTWIKDAGLDEHQFRSHAMMHAASILNRMPRRAIDWRVPVMMAFGVKPDLARIGIFGSAVQALVPKDRRDSKVADKSIKGTYLGWDPDRITAEPGHLIYSRTTKRILSSNSVAFDHDSVLPRREQALAILPEMCSPDDKWWDEVSECQPCYAIHDTFGIAATPKDPANRADMLNGPYAKEFLEAEIDEICNLFRMGMLKPIYLEDLEPDDVVLRTTWSYKLKMEAGVIKRFRSRWCARGDLENSSDLATFSAMASSSCIRMLFCLLGGGVFKGIDLFDVGNAFASAPTRRRVFVNQPPGYWDGSSTVFQLMRAFYGQRDAGRLFWLHLEDVLMKHGWKRSSADPCIWTKGSVEQGNLAVLATHVDDILCFYQDKGTAIELRKSLESSFERITTTEQPTQAIGMEIEYGKDYVKVHQTSYVEALERRFNFSKEHGLVTPASSTIDDELGTPLGNDQKALYQQLVGSILYLTCQTRADLAFAACRVARGMSNPTDKDMAAVRRLMGHIWITKNVGLTYRKFEFNGCLQLNAFVDAEFAGDKVDRRSTTGSCHRIGSSAVFSWRSQKQKLTSRSSTESELIALASETDDTVVFRQLLVDMNLICMVPTPVHVGEPGDTELEGATVHEDNSSAVIIVRDRLYGSRTKFLDVRLGTLRERERDRILKMTLIGTKEQLADIFTKQLSHKDHENMKNRLMDGDLNNVKTT